jgi:UDP-N-acetylmuramate dehydrogenase
MRIEENISLKEFTTFKIGGKAKYFSILRERSELPEIIKFAQEKNLPIFVLGGGSNIIISDGDLNFVVIKNEILGREILNESEKEVTISVGAGESWDDFVAFCVEREFFGLEALSAIPGTVGGAPIQNIGAYGTEVAQGIESVVVYDIQEKVFKTLVKSECQFGYRESVFKKLPERYVVLQVIFSLKKNSKITIPNYPGVSEKLKNLEIIEPTLADIRKVVIEIRANKLPDPRFIPNVGSFF